MSNDNKKIIVIDGRFVGEKLTGVQRSAWEILKELSLYDELKIIVALPPNVRAPSDGCINVEYLNIGKFRKNLWEQISLPRYCKKKNLPLLCMCNLAPKYNQSYVILHDVRSKDMKQFDSLKSKVLFETVVKRYIYSCKKIFTVSEFSKNRILYNYPKLKNKVPIVIGNGYEHILRVQPKHVDYVPSDFYLSVGSVLQHKNFLYVLNLAKNNPDKNFVIVGKNDVSYDEFIKDNNIKNCYFTGHISNEEIKWLYEKCMGFILPSFYEGFGIPPLEAVASGCRNIYLSDIPVFKEIFGECAVFFDPYNYNNLVDITVQQDKVYSEESFLTLLEKYSWKNVAKRIVEAITQD